MKVNHLDVVQQLHASSPPTSGDLASCLVFQLRLLALLAVRFPGEQWGLLLADGENILPYHGQGVKVGRVCDPSGQLYKILTDIPTTNAPDWTDNNVVDPARYLAFTANGTPPPPDPTPVPSVDLRPVLERLEQLQTALAQLAARNEALYKDLATRTDELKRIAQQPQHYEGTARLPFIGSGPVTLDRK